MKTCHCYDIGNSILVIWHHWRDRQVAMGKLAMKMCGLPRAYARGVGLGWNPPLNLLCYKNVITYAKEIVYVFVHFLLVWCQLNAKTTEWFCMKISRNTVNGPKRNNYILVGIWLIACIKNHLTTFCKPPVDYVFSCLCYVIVHFIRDNCLYFVRSARALKVLAWLLYQLLWHGRTS